MRIAVAIRFAIFASLQAFRVDALAARAGLLIVHMENVDVRAVTARVESIRIDAHERKIAIGQTYVTSRTFAKRTTVHNLPVLLKDTMALQALIVRVLDLKLNVANDLHSGNRGRAFSVHSYLHRQRTTTNATCAPTVRITPRIIPAIRYGIT